MNVYSAFSIPAWVARVACGGRQTGSPAAFGMLHHAKWPGLETEPLKLTTTGSLSRDGTPCRTQTCDLLIRSLLRLLSSAWIRSPGVVFIGVLISLGALQTVPQRESFAQLLHKCCTQPHYYSSLTGRPKRQKYPHVCRGAIEQAHRLADGYNRQFMILRQLRDLRRYAPIVIQNNGGQVNLGL